MSEQHQYIEDFLPKEEARLNRFEPLGCGDSSDATQALVLHHK